MVHEPGSQGLQAQDQEDQGYAIIFSLPLFTISTHMLQSLTSRRRQNLRFSSLDSGNSFHSPFTPDGMT
jgi:hypothetical protein